METVLKANLKHAYETGKQTFIQEGSEAPSRYEDLDKQIAFATGYKDAHARGCLSIMFGKHIGIGLVIVGFLVGLIF